LLAEGFHIGHISNLFCDNLLKTRISCFIVLLDRNNFQSKISGPVFFGLVSFHTFLFLCERTAADSSSKIPPLLSWYWQILSHKQSIFFLILFFRILTWAGGFQYNLSITSMEGSN